MALVYGRCPHCFAQNIVDDTVTTVSCPHCRRDYDTASAIRGYCDANHLPLPLAETEESREGPIYYFGKTAVCEEQFEQVRTALAENRRVDAIKLIRSLSGLTLKDSKELADNFGSIDFTRAQDISPADPKEKQGCYIATAVYGSYDCPQVWTLRRFRDHVLKNSAAGRSFIRCYYTVSPVLVRLFGKSRWFSGLFRPALDALVNRLNRSGTADTPYIDLPSECNSL